MWGYNSVENDISGFLQRDEPNYSQKLIWCIGLKSDFVVGQDCDRILNC